MKIEDCPLIGELRSTALVSRNGSRLSTPVEMRGDNRMTSGDFNVWSVQATSRHHPFGRRIEVPSC